MRRLARRASYGPVRASRDQQLCVLSAQQTTLSTAPCIHTHTHHHIHSLRRPQSAPANSKSGSTRKLLSPEK